MQKHVADIRKGATVFRDGKEYKVLGRREFAGKDAQQYGGQRCVEFTTGEGSLIVTADSWLETVE